MGPTVWELDGPIPIVKRSKVLIAIEKYALPCGGILYFSTRTRLSGSSVEDRRKS